ncbi:hypothetical protein FRC08_008351 [Ceratobasidium sp. 394]|nr:hypothetical protein FRC08_008351 [Ceratobasidium sp. 394]
MAYVDSLELISLMHCQSLLYSILGCLIGSGEEPTPMRVVRVIHDKEHDPLQFKKQSPLLFRRYSNDPEHKAFFSSLVALDLRNVYPLWDHLILTNLVELRFEAPNLDKGFFVTQVRLAATLASCPKLRSLMLFGLRVTPAPAETGLRPAVLDELRVLSLRRMAMDRSLERVLSIVAPGLHPLHLSIHLPGEDESNPKLLAELRSFFCRSNVTIFYADSTALHTWFASQLSPLPNVHTLVLRACHISDATGSSRNRHNNPCPIDPSTVLWPRLRNLHLIRCGLDKTHLRRLLLLHAIQNLYLRQVFDDTHPNVDLSITAQFLEECRLLLSDLVPNIEIVEDAHDVTADWTFVGTPLWYGPASLL